MMRNFIQIIGLCVLLSIGYGIVHDQITIRISPPYFTEFHPTIIETDNLTLIAFIWGIIATWWMGLGLGLLLASAACLGHWPPMKVRQLYVPMAYVLILMTVGAVLFGYLGSFRKTESSMPGMLVPKGSYADPSRHYICLFAHNASYFFGLVGATACSGWALFKRIGNVDEVQEKRSQGNNPG